MTRRMLAILIALIVVLSFAGCTSTEDVPNEEELKELAAAEAIRIGEDYYGNLCKTHPSYVSFSEIEVDSVEYIKELSYFDISCGLDCIVSGGTETKVWPHRYTLRLELKEDNTFEIIDSRFGGLG